ncbi:MAG: arginine decarboxylase [Halobacteriales archaeon]|jgi:arginine decarboxylase
MEPIRVVWGTGGGPTEIAAYDAALAAANVHDYNLVPISSVIPAGTEVRADGTAPNLGPIGERLTVVQADTTKSGAGTISAGLGWTQASDGRGLFYEGAGAVEAGTVREEIERGLEAGVDLRDWEPEATEIRTVTTAEESEEYVAAVAVAVYGDSEPLL